MDWWAKSGVHLQCKATRIHVVMQRIRKPILYYTEGQATARCTCRVKRCDWEFSVALQGRVLWYLNGSKCMLSLQLPSDKSTASGLACAWHIVWLKVPCDAWLYYIFPCLSKTFLVDCLFHCHLLFSTQLQMFLLASAAHHHQDLKRALILIWSNFVSIHLPALRYTCAFKTQDVLRCRAKKRRQQNFSWVD